MKAHRNMLLLSLIAGIISLIFVIILNPTTKLFQIALAFIGSSFISFILELPNYLSLKKGNSDILYYSLNDIKANALSLIYSINNIFDNQIITDNFYEQFVQNLLISSDKLRTFDQNFYFFKTNNAAISGTIYSISNAVNNVHISALAYRASYWSKRVDINTKERCERNIIPVEMNNELKNILSNLEALINIINTQAPHIFSKNQYKLWLNNDANLINANNNFYTNKK